MQWDNFNLQVITFTTIRTTDPVRSPLLSLVLSNDKWLETVIHDFAIFFLLREGFNSFVLIRLGPAKHVVLIF